MEEARASISSQRLASTFDTLIDSQEPEITFIHVFRYESFPTGNNGDIPVSVQELVYGCKAAGVGNSEIPLDRHNKLLSSTEEVHGPRRDSRSFEGLDTNVLQRTGPKDKSLVENPKNVFRVSEETFGPKEEQQPSVRSSSHLKQESISTSAKKGKEIPKEQSEGQEKGKTKSKWSKPQPQKYRI
ncbi:hypothetical protein O181_000454 [Austropuccinia psidii MF-1]|uniref:Uncharacterized protein n=1 Tax=Austropuccinia psidii MF-1 TaxID=1389203 RepID=A0A9Q3B8M3_9BASI|nr:hypothetical protein [Austropuccinia psidii MF-1]